MNKCDQHEVMFSEVQWSSVKFSKFQWSSVNFSEVQWSSMKFSEVQWSSMKFNEVQWISVNISEVQCTSSDTSRDHIEFRLEDGHKVELKTCFYWLLAEDLFTYWELLFCECEWSVSGVWRKGILCCGRTPPIKWLYLPCGLPSIYDSIFRFKLKFSRVCFIWRALETKHSKI
jgi:hypothetical protein